MFRGDAIVFGFSDSQYDRRFTRTLLETNVWQVGDTHDMPKYDIVTPGTTMKLRTFIRKKQ